MTPGTLLVRFPVHSYDFSKSPYHPLRVLRRASPRLGVFRFTFNRVSVSGAFALVGASAFLSAPPHLFFSSRYLTGIRPTIPKTLRGHLTCKIHRSYMKRLLLAFCNSNSPKIVIFGEFPGFLFCYLLPLARCPTSYAKSPTGPA